MQYRKGTYTNPASAVAVSLELGFIPSKFQVYQYTGWGTNDQTLKAEWFQGMPDASALLTTRGTTTLSSTLETTNGITPFSNGALWDTTQAVITGATKANPCVITATAHGFATGDTVTISAVLGMVQLNTNRYIITVIDANSFSLTDLFGNVVDSTAFSTYVSGGIANKISTDTTPPGLQEDEGSAGVTIGTAAVGPNDAVMYWEAFLDTPTGY